MMKNALNCAPHKCLCGSRLHKPIYGTYGKGYQDKGHYIRCKCHALYIWSFPNVWIRTHELPLFRLAPEYNRKIVA